MITFDDVTKSFPDGTTAVEGLDLEIAPGKITVFVGPSGCGKTTSLRMINRMIDPTSGTISVDGKNILDVAPAQLRRGIGYVIQNAGLFPHRTIVDNIATVPMLIGQSKATARTRASELMELVGLDPAMAKRYPAQLSGGQQQRVGVARALAADPPIMLMDEPFSAVDPVVRESLQQEFLRLQSDLGKTIVFVTHDIDEAIKLGDVVCVFKVGGTLAQVAPPDELLEHPADDFVSGFIGRDRGYRGLSFITADALRIEDVPTVTGSGAAASDWTVVVDDAHKPLGWLPPGSAAGTPPLSTEGSFALTDPVRRAIDIALLSPSGQAIALGEDGKMIGAVSHESIARTLRELRQHEDGNGTTARHGSPSVPDPTSAG